MVDPAQARPNALHGWLAAVIPADARRFHVADSDLAATLVDAGAVLARELPDVEIAPPAELRGDAACAIVPLGTAQREGGSLLVRAPRRLVRSVSVRGLAVRYRQALRRLGYGVTTTVLWDLDSLLLVPGLPGRIRDRSPAELLPQRAVVVGTRGAPGPTVLEAVAADAGRAVGSELHYGWPLARQAIMVVISEAGVLRVSVGPGRWKMDRQRAALEALARCAPAPIVADRVPWRLAEGRAGLADWSLDRRLPGSLAGGAPSAAVMDDCLDFLVALFQVGEDGAPASGISDAAERLASFCDREELRTATLRLGERLEADLAGLPRGFAHGDFWTGNLLLQEGRLSGVVDWDGAGPGCLPLGDLVHLCLSVRQAQRRQYFGQALVEYLLPLARAGGGRVIREYCRRIGLPTTGRLIEDLGLAYWLERITFQLVMFPDRATRPVWMRHNVELVLESLAG